MQLQGELQARSIKTKQVYPNALSGFFSILKKEGLQGIQRGLLTAYGYQVILNGTRLGLYEPVKDQLQIGVDSLTGSPNSLPILSMIGSGAATGVLGAFLASPLFLIKTVSSL
jgi:solute carrier family 25 protein 34/35